MKYDDEINVSNNNFALLRIVLLRTKTEKVFETLTQILDVYEFCFQLIIFFRVAFLFLLLDRNRH